MLDVIELTIEQQQTIELSFKTEQLKGEMLLNKQFDYDFDFEDEE